MGVGGLNGCGWVALNGYGWVALNGCGWVEWVWVG